MQQVQFFFLLFDYKCTQVKRTTSCRNFKWIQGCYKLDFSFLPIFPNYLYGQTARRTVNWKFRLEFTLWSNSYIQTANTTKVTIGYFWECLIVAFQLFRLLRHPSFNSRGQRSNVHLKIYNYAASTVVMDSRDSPAWNFRLALYM